MSKRVFSVFLFFSLAFVLYSNEIVDEDMQEITGNYNGQYGEIYGNVDIPPSDALNAFQATQTTSARLNVRSGPSTDSPLLTTLEAGTVVQVLETGPQASIGGTIAPWVRVLTGDGYTGWCFSGFLVTAIAAGPAVPAAELAPGVVPLPLAGPGALPPAAPAAVAMPPLPEAESGTLLAGLPWVWFALAGGVLLVAAALAIALRKRKVG